MKLRNGHLLLHPELGLTSQHRHLKTPGREANHKFLTSQTCGDATIWDISPKPACCTGIGQVFGGDPHFFRNLAVNRALSPRDLSASVSRIFGSTMPQMGTRSHDPENECSPSACFATVGRNLWGGATKIGGSGRSNQSFWDWPRNPRRAHKDF
jgi:hypothetical protein